MSHNPTLTSDQAKPLLIQGKGWPGMRVSGVLSFPKTDAASLHLPAKLHVDVLDLSGHRELANVPADLRCFELNLSGTSIRSLPADVQVESNLNLSGCEELIELPRGLQVGTLNLRGCRSLAMLPDDLDVWFLDLTGCWSFSVWPSRATIRSGRLILRGCVAMHSLPDYLGPLAALNVRDCPNLRDLPESLRITGWVDVAQSGLADSRRLPASLRGVDLRWQGVRIDERMLLHPESIQLDEVLAETNAERRRVMLDRFGMSRFMTESKAAVLDNDTDPGGPRSLLRVELKDDEALATLSCLCPSTGRQYFLRVPPGTTTCRQAAAWIAGFDNPDDYQPTIET